jgi:hypothetical protein
MFCLFDACENGMAVARECEKRDANSMLQEGLQLGCYHAWVSEQFDQRSRISVALDGSNVCGDAMTYCGSVLEDGHEWPERSMWLPPKVFVFPNARSKNKIFT